MLQKWVLKNLWLVWRTGEDLNTLSNIFGKPAKEIFNEFDGKDYEEQIFDGDVKYHLGWTSKRKSDKGFGIYLNLRQIRHI